MKEDMEALLVWKHPLTRERYVIGRLSRRSEGYSYRNELDQRHSLLEAMDAGFTPLAMFGTERSEQVSSQLFPVFARRLPPDWREAEYRTLGLETDQDIEYLLKTGGRMSGDTFEFLRPIPEAPSGGQLTLDFPVAGWRYYQGETVITDLKPGTSLRLELETENQFDPSAIKILTQQGVHLGYVPRVYSWYIDDCIDEQRYKAEVQEIGPIEAPQLRMTVHLCVADPHLRQIPEGLGILAQV